MLGLAIQVKRGTNDDESTRLIRIWAVNAVTPLEKAIVWVQGGIGNLWHNYVYLRGVRQENRDLKIEIEQLASGASASERRRSSRPAGCRLAGVQGAVHSKTIAAQVIGSSGSEQSRSVYIDKGSHDGVQPDMAVITADGVVGKVLRVFGSTSQVLVD